MVITSAGSYRTIPLFFAPHNLGVCAVMNLASLTRTVVCATFLMLAPCLAARGDDPLPSWREGETKRAILEFVTRTTKQGSPEFVPPVERIAVFDNDGTLWSEQPMYTQLLFALDRVKALAPQHPEWKEKEPFASLLKGDVKGALGGGEHAILEILMTTHAGTTTAEFEKIVKDWIATARHPTTKRPYTEMVYQPMLEVLAYLRANGFKTYIVSGGGIEFMRPWTEKVYGVPPEQVIGSSIKTKLEMRDGLPVLVRLPEINFIDDGPGKPVGINQHIGRRPIAAFGNSDGDFRCCNGPPPARALDLDCSCTTPTPTESGRTTASPKSVASHAASTKPQRAAGFSWT